MFWDNIAFAYDGFERAVNRKAYIGMRDLAAAEIEEGDVVLECACGPGSITEYIAPLCRLVYATDMSVGMLRQCRKRCAGFDNVRVRRLDMMHINAKDNTFDKVIAGNVIHLLDDPEAAVRELARVCKKGGKLIIPTYIGGENKKASALSSFVSLMGAHFREKYTLDSYADLFDRMGFEEITITIADGMIPCAVAVITK